MGKSLYRQVSFPSSLSAAWAVIKHNGSVSNSTGTRRAIDQYAKHARQKIDRIYRALLNDKHEFNKATGIAIKRNGKDPRPLVVSEIPDRIVQRSLLDCIQSIPLIQESITHEGSYGSLKGRGVRDAIAKAIAAEAAGGTFFIRSDIKSFFNQIPRKEALSQLTKLLPDRSLNQLLDAATTIELSNLAILRQHPDLFPTHEIGVAQGSCLSPLLGNIVLRNFDAVLNTNGLVCIRYVDDFLLIGRSEKQVTEGFKEAVRLLDDLDMTVYDPSQDDKKAEFGPTSRSYNFLGCIIGPGSVAPGRASVNKLKGTIHGLVNSSLNRMKSNSEAGDQIPKEHTLIGTLGKMNDILKAWGNQYSYCTIRGQFGNIDKYANDEIRRLLTGYNDIRGKNTDITRRVLGVHLMTDSNYDPITAK